MLVKLSSLFIILIGSVSWASGLDAKSARREPGSSYLAYKTQAQILSQFTGSPNLISAVDEAKAYSTIKATLPAATVWESETLMQEAFEKFRDYRFLDDRARPGFKRRSTWLYPDDGCFARAALAILNLGKWNYAVPKKVFVFGDLAVKSENSPWGEVTWWYHVAPLVEVEGQKFVLDPSMDSRKPIPLDDWLGKMNKNPGALEVAICGSGSYTPYDPCYRESDGIESLAFAEQGHFLGPEWSRVHELGRNPENELGDLPPWIANPLPFLGAH